MLIEELKALRKAERELKKEFYSTVKADKGYIFLSIHCDLSIESMMPLNPKEQLIINWLNEHGYEQINRIDCSQRNEDRYDTIIYHYRKYYTLDGDDHEFLKDWANPEFRYCLFKVYHKWGIL